MKDLIATVLVAPAVTAGCGTAAADDDDTARRACEARGGAYMEVEHDGLAAGHCHK